MTFMLGQRQESAVQYPEVWSGVECTINRVGDQFFDQLTRTEHCTRLDDLDRFADLGIRALRFPLLWERLQPERGVDPDWNWSDQALQRLRDRGVRPILGLLHHGHGPSWTGMRDPQFAEHFARYARMVAERYPWIDAYTPVNEPLTTARFSGLYGHWYPHARDDASYIRFLLAQCQAVARAMQEIRMVNADAQLVQTEDLGKVMSTARLAYQRKFENERRWLTWDLLSGTVNQLHPLWTYLQKHGVTASDIALFISNPCPPNIIGVNHYVTSERFLDDRVEHYALEDLGGNGRDTYVDIATVQAVDAFPIGIEGILREAWHRYRRPIAITECHLGCTREEQMRWLHEVWRAGVSLRAQGVDVRAVTSWALLGSYDWNSLVTREGKHYEPGAFDMRAPSPRPTAIATMIQSLAQQGSYIHPVLRTAGWWHQHVPMSNGARVGGQDVSHASRAVLITGATGTLGRELARACESRGITYHLVGREALDIASPDSVVQALQLYRPWAVINAAGYVDVDRAEVEQARCFRENTAGATNLAAACARDGIRYVTYSSDLVFSGRKGTPYVESDPTDPINVYGESKARAEAVILRETPNSLIIRTGAFFGPWDQYNLVTKAMHALIASEPFEVADDLIITPTYVPDLAHTTLDLLLDGEQAIWHLSNGTPITWSELVHQAAERLAVPTTSLITQPASHMASLAARPNTTVLASERGWTMPSFESALDRYATLVRDQLRPEIGVAYAANDSYGMTLASMAP